MARTEEMICEYRAPATEKFTPGAEESSVLADYPEPPQHPEQTGIACGRDGNRAGQTEPESPSQANEQRQRQKQRQRRNDQPEDIQREAGYGRHIVRVSVEPDEGEQRSERQRRDQSAEHRAALGNLGDRHEDHRRDDRSQRVVDQVHPPLPTTTSDAGAAISRSATAQVSDPDCEPLR